MADRTVKNRGLFSEGKLWRRGVLPWMELVLIVEERSASILGNMEWIFWEGGPLFCPIDFMPEVSWFWNAFFQKKKKKKVTSDVNRVLSCVDWNVFNQYSLILRTQFPLVWFGLILKRFRITLLLIPQNFCYTESSELRSMTYLITMGHVAYFAEICWLLY